jgi:DNA polymerase-1
MTIALIDGDMVSFRCAISAEGETEAFTPLSRVDAFIDEVMAQTGAASYEIWLSGKNNFRYDVYPEYKANRVDAKRPKWEKETKDYLCLTHNAQVVEGAEADDALGFRMTELGEEGICVTNDKDLKQIPGHHYDPVKKLLFDVTPLEGTRFFYYQMLVGDPVDNIKGVPGIGPVKANRLLDSVVPEEWHQAVMNLYSCEEEFEMNAKCLYIWKERGGEPGAD